MGKYNNLGTAPKAKTSSPVTTTGRTQTALGASGFTRSDESDLYLLSVSGIIDKTTFHEMGIAREERYVDLLHRVTLASPAHVLGMMPWLRTSGYMRSASVMGAAEAAKVLCDEHRYAGVEDMVDGSLQRADEPGEFLAYWFSIAGKGWPKRYLPVKQALKRAVGRLYTEYTYGKYDSPKRAYRFADVISLIHPKPVDATQEALFRLLLDWRHGAVNSDLEGLPMLGTAATWHRIASEDPKSQFLLDPDMVKNAGLTWEHMLSALGKHRTRAELWEAIIPNMGIGALLKNLRNFEEAEISREASDKVVEALSNPKRVRGGKVFPHSFLTAHRHVNSLRWGQALEDGLAASLEAVPALTGHTLILVDRSPSMFPGESFSTPHKGDITLADQAAVFGSAIAKRADKATLVEFGGTTTPYGHGGTGSRQIVVRKGASVLKMVDSFGDSISGTDIPRAVSDNFLPGVHDRVVIITDEQSRPGYLPSNMSDYGGMRETSIDDLIPKSTPVYLWNMAGYSASILDAAKPNRHAFGGLSDASFGLIALLENGRNASWPWEV